MAENLKKIVSNENLDKYTEIISQKFKQLSISKEDTENKVTEWSDVPNDTNYPSEKLVKDTFDSLVARNTTSGWDSQPQLRSGLNVFYIYTDTGRVKVGDGTSYLIDMPYVDDFSSNLIENHINNTLIHITAEERQKWNNKLNYVDPGSTDLLEFTRD